MGNNDKKTNKKAVTSKTAKRKTHWDPTEWEDPKTVTVDKSDNKIERHTLKNIDERRGHKSFKDRLKQYKQNRTFHEKNSTSKLMEKAHGQINN